MTDILLAAHHLVKHYAGVTALSDGSLEVRSGEVLALMGANGSGKSTLGKIIVGVVAHDAGQLLLDGQEVHFSSPQAAQKSGIVEVHQELSLLPNMTVAENIWLAHEPLNRIAFVSRREIHARTQKLLDLFADTTRSLMQPGALVSTLSPDERQIVEILKALSLEPRIMILDEATASLDSRQVQRLFELMSQWKAQNRALVFVSHRMDEIFRVADRVTVLRSGKTVMSGLLKETNERELVSMMVESTVVSRYIKHDEETHGTAPTRVRVENLHTSVVRGVSFELHDGELLGLGGLRGQGQNDVLLALFGALPFTGNIMLTDRQVHFTHPKQAMRAGVAYVPGDRGTEGLLPIRSILENLQLPSWQHYGVPLKLQAARQDATTMAQRLNIVMSSLNNPVSSLSGGNAQKVVLGKWLLRNPQVLLLDDPTKGVDVNAKGDFYKILSELKDTGAAILFYSSDDEELLGLCDRVLVLHDGQLQAELTGARLTRSDLVAASMGTT
jgi:ribose transport system ATP-binding protein